MMLREKFEDLRTIGKMGKNILAGRDMRSDISGESRMGSVMIELILGIILVIIGLAMSTPMNTQITNITSGANATAQGAAAVAMWGMVPLMLGVILLMIPLGQVFMAFRQGKGN
jgi:uncharacterized membrane protein